MCFTTKCWCPWKVTSTNKPEIHAWYWTMAQQAKNKHGYIKTNTACVRLYVSAWIWLVWFCWSPCWLGYRDSYALEKKMMSSMSKVYSSPSAVAWQTGTLTGINGTSGLADPLHQITGEPWRAASWATTHRYPQNNSQGAYMCFLFFCADEEAYGGIYINIEFRSFPMRVSVLTEEAN